MQFSNSVGILPSPSELASPVGQMALPSTLSRLRPVLGRVAKESDPREEAWIQPDNAFVGRARWWPKQGPSNRSEAAQLSYKLDQLLAEAKQDFRLQFLVHNAVFSEVIKQVAVHCGERGELLNQLSAFYTRATEKTARAAERSLNKKLSTCAVAVDRSPATDLLPARSAIATDNAPSPIASIGDRSSS